MRAHGCTPAERHRRASPSSEQPTRGLDVAREERLYRLLDPYCGHIVVVTAGAGICTDGALWCTLDGLDGREIPRCALWCTLLHHVANASQAEGRGFETRVPLSEIAGDFASPISGRGPAWTKLLRAAERGDGDEVHELAVRMAHEVLSSPIVALAHQILAGGPHATAKAIELAEHLLKNASPALASLPAASSSDREVR